MNKAPFLAAASVIAMAGGALAADAFSGASSPFPIQNGVKILYNQNSDDAGARINSQNFSSGTNSRFDNQGADDFIIPGGRMWRVRKVDVTGAYFNGSGPASSVNVYFYHDNKGAPGKSVEGGMFNDLAASRGTGSFSIALPKALKLKAGHYWVSVVANLNYVPHGGEWGWEMNYTVHNDPAGWENPDGGFGIGCTTWGTLESCWGYIGDFMFDLKGTSKDE